jgi:hypothetical protein
VIAMTDLADLLTRGLAERSKKRGEILTPHAAWQEFAHVDGQPIVSYELIRRVLNEGHTNIGDRAADAIALMSGKPVEDVLEAAGKRPRLKPFKLPSRADRLSKEERRVVLGVVNAILDAHEKEGPGSGTPAQKTLTAEDVPPSPFNPADAPVFREEDTEQPNQ